MTAICCQRVNCSSSSSSNRSIRRRSSSVGRSARSCACQVLVNQRHRHRALADGARHALDRPRCTSPATNTPGTLLLLPSFKFVFATDDLGGRQVGGQVVDLPVVLAQAGRGHQGGQRVPLAGRRRGHGDAARAALRLGDAGGDEPLADRGRAVLGGDGQLAGRPGLPDPAQRRGDDLVAQPDEGRARGEAREVLPRRASSPAASAAYSRSACAAQSLTWTSCGARRRPPGWPSGRARRLRSPRSRAASCGRGSVPCRTQP